MKPVFLCLVCLHLMGCECFEEYSLGNVASLDISILQQTSKVKTRKKRKEKEQSFSIPPRHSCIMLCVNCFSASTSICHKFWFHQNSQNTALYPDWLMNKSVLLAGEQRNSSLTETVY